MAKLVLFAGVVGTFILMGMGWANLTQEKYTGKVGEKGGHASCPTVFTNFVGMTLPDDLTACSCPVQAVAKGPYIPIHAPAELVAAAVPTDEIRISWHEYKPPLGGKRQTAVSWELQRGADRKNYSGTPAKPIYTSLVLMGLAPAGIGIVLSFLLSILFRKQEG